ncbi:MAG: TonB-dependent receptor [Deltaproteobacteria bacterium]|nr:TonB-dependent receptor [Deltaproteobacteria bacterium]
MRALLAAAVLVALPGLAEAQRCEATIDGQVVDDESGEALPSVTITAGDATATTDDSGRFSLSGVCPGPQVLRAERADYKTRELRVRAPAAGVAVAMTARAIDRLDDLVVEASVPEVMSPQAQTVLDGEALDRTRGRALADSLAEVPGVQVLRSGRQAKPIVRGQFGRRLAILFDGIRHESQKWGLDHAPELDPFAAGSMTVIKGAAGVQYGPDAVGGVILIEPPKLRAKPGVGGAVHLVGASNGRQGSGAARLDFVPTAVPELALRAELSATRGAAPSTPDYALDNLGIAELNGAVSAGYRLRTTTDFKVSYRRYQARSGICLCLSNESPDSFFTQLELDRPQGSELYTSEYSIERPLQDVVHDTAMVRGSHLFGAGTLTLTYAFQHDRRLELDLVRSSIDVAQADFKLTTHMADAVWESAEVGALGGQLSVRAGTSAIVQKNIFSGLPLIPNFESLGAGVFGLARLARGPVTVEAGARVDQLGRDVYLTDNAHRRLVNDDKLDDGDCESVSGGQVFECDASYRALSASLGVVSKLGRGLSLRLEASQTQRIPLVDELFINGTAPSSPVLALGDPALELETVRGGSLTLNARNSLLAAELSIYGNLTSDYIYFAPRLGDDGELDFEVLVRGAFPVFENRGIDAHFYGADLGITIVPVDGLSVTGQANLVRGRNRSDDEFLLFVPPDRYSMRAAYMLPALGPMKNNRVGGSLEWATRQKRFDPVADFKAPPPAYVLFGAVISTEVEISGLPWTFELTGHNLGNRRYRDYTSLLRYFADEPGLDARLRVSTRF